MCPPPVPQPSVTASTAMSESDYGVGLLRKRPQRCIGVLINYAPRASLCVFDTTCDPMCARVQRATQMTPLPTPAPR